MAAPLYRIFKAKIYLYTSMMDLLIVLMVVCVFSIAQSVIGVGLLVFGTPTFILLGYSFPETLGIVLPPSILLSLIQVIESTSQNKKFRKEFNLFCVPFVLLGLLLALEYDNLFNLNYLVGAMLLVGGFLKLSPKLEQALFQVIKKYRKFYQILMGSIHGLSNMGGGLLTIFSSSIHNNDKVETRGGVAYGYLIMGIIQYTTLIFYNNSLLNIQVLYCLIIAGVTYFLLGKRIFSITQDGTFQKFITAIIIFYGVILLVN